MSVPFLDLTIKDSSVRSAMGRVISNAIDTCSFIGGSEVQLFADEFGAYCGKTGCVTVANGTDALILALRALGIGPNDEVITVPFTFIATAEAITHVGATVKFVDINPHNYTLDVSLLEKAVTSKTKAILPVHLFGQPADMDPILEIARAHKLKVVEDAAQAHGAQYKGRMVGALGDVGCFSFYPTKNLGAFGDGGAVTSNSSELLKKIAQLADHGRADRYYHTVEGVNSRLDAFQAAILRIKLRHLDEQNERRRSIATEYNKALRGHLYISAPTIEPYAKHVFHLYSVETSHREGLARYLKDKGVGCGVYYPLPLHLQPACAKFGLAKGSFPASEMAAERILALPIYGTMPDEHVSRVCDVLRKFVPC